MSECTHNCETCGESCEKRDLIEKTREENKIKKVFAVVSGKGGVGKSTVSSLLAVAMSKRGNEVAVLDGDVTGPSIPKAFGITEKATGGEDYLLPVKSTGGVSIMSVNLLLDNESDPVIWRAPLITGVIKQFWSQVVYGEVDYMFVDMPPGTGDVPLTVFQSLPLDGIIVVTSPSDLVSMIVGKAVKMASMMNIPVVGVVENYAYARCPDCGKEFDIFGKSHVKELCEKYGLPLIARLPIDTGIAQMMDSGKIEDYDGTEMNYAADLLESIKK